MLQLEKLRLRNTQLEDGMATLCTTLHLAHPLREQTLSLSSAYKNQDEGLGEGTQSTGGPSQFRGLSPATYIDPLGTFSLGCWLLQYVVYMCAHVHRGPQIHVTHANRHLGFTRKSSVLWLTSLKRGRREERLEGEPGPHRQCGQS